MDASDQKDNSEQGLRTHLLLRMYDQMFNDISRHILVVWHCVGAVIGSFALLALADKGVLTMDEAVTLMVIVSFWLLAHVYDASNWYNRDLAIIANIEKQFLKQSDLKDILYYFAKHRPPKAMLTHLRIQWFLGVGILLVFVLFHFGRNVWPCLWAGFVQVIYQGTWPDFRQVSAKNILSISMPYLATVVSALLLLWHRRRRIASYEEFLCNSPGKDIDSEGIRFGVGHGRGWTRNERQ